MSNWPLGFRIGLLASKAYMIERDPSWLERCEAMGVKVPPECRPGIEIVDDPMEGAEPSAAPSPPPVLMRGDDPLFTIPETKVELVSPRSQIVRHVSTSAQLGPSGDMKLVHAMSAAQLLAFY
mgnify:CR=1 FL=1